MYENLISHRDLYFLRFWDYRDLEIKKQGYKKQDSILLNKEIQDKLIYVERYLAFH